MNDGQLLFCNICSRETRHRPLREPVVTFEVEAVVSWYVTECLGCASVAFCVERSGDGEDERDFVLYPVPERHPCRDLVGVPANLEQLYRDAVQAFNSDLLIFCAAALRALVEGICAEQGVRNGPRMHDGQAVLDDAGVPRRGKTLDCMIEGLVERQLLMPRDAAILHEQRFMGNVALHQLQAPDRHALQLSLGLVEHVMAGLYDVQGRLEELQRLRQNPPTEQTHAQPDPADDGRTP